MAKPYHRLARLVPCLSGTGRANAVGGAARFRPSRTRQDTHVEAGAEVPRDPGSIPGASTKTTKALRPEQPEGLVVSWVTSILPNFSITLGRSGLESRL